MGVGLIFVFLKFSSEENNYPVPSPATRIYTDKPNALLMDISHATRARTRSHTDSHLVSTNPSHRVAGAAVQSDVLDSFGRLVALSTRSINLIVDLSVAAALVVFELSTSLRNYKRHIQ